MTGRSLNGSRYGPVAWKAARFRDSGGRKPEVVIRVVSDECERVRKPRIVSMMVPEALLIINNRMKVGGYGKWI